MNNKDKIIASMFIGVAIVAEGAPCLLKFYEHKKSPDIPEVSYVTEIRQVVSSVSSTSAIVGVQIVKI